MSEIRLLYLFDGNWFKLAILCFFDIVVPPPFFFDPIDRRDRCLSKRCSTAAGVV